MVYFVSGAIDSGKTTRIRDIYSEIDKGCGFISRKLMADGKLVGYDIVDLVGGGTHPLARIKEVFFSSETTANVFSFGKFSFLADGFSFGEELIRCNLRNRAEDADPYPIFIDEIGRLEVSGRGFSTLFREILSLPCDIYAGVRSAFIRDVADFFAISDFQTIPV